MKKSLFLLLMSLSVVITSCNEDDGLSSAKNERKDIVLTRSQEEMVNENVKFAFSFFNKVNKQETQKTNWIVSPLSASIALSMTANGAGGNSQDQILNTLGFKGFQMDDTNGYYNYLYDELVDADNTTQFSVANSVWLHDDYKFYDSFVKTMKDMYDAEVATLDLSDQSSLKKINDWSAKHTNNLIPVILEQLPVDLRCCLVNSLYFKGVWKDKFNESATKDEIFTSANGRQNLVKMMKQEKSYMYCSNESFSLAEFPYGNEAFSMVVLLPNEDCTLEESLQKFTADYWTESMSLKREFLNVSFPRFELKYEADLIEVMRSLGITEIFDREKADFTNLSPNRTFVNLLKQSVYLKVDEKGTEVAATTMSGMTSTDNPILKTKDFNINRPFAFLIKEKSTGVILFIGKVTEL